MALLALRALLAALLALRSRFAARSALLALRAMRISRGTLHTPLVDVGVAVVAGDVDVGASDVAGTRIGLGVTPDANVGLTPVASDADEAASEGARVVVVVGVATAALVDSVTGTRMGSGVTPEAKVGLTPVVMPEATVGATAAAVEVVAATEEGRLLLEEAVVVAAGVVESVRVTRTGSGVTPEANVGLTPVARPDAGDSSLVVVAAELMLVDVDVAADVEAVVPSVTGTKMGSGVWPEEKVGLTPVAALVDSGAGVVEIVVVATDEDEEEEVVAGPATAPDAVEVTSSKMGDGVTPLE